jgi:hypothetical protein
MLESEKLSSLTEKEAGERGWGTLHSAYQLLKEANTSEEATALGNREEVLRLLLKLLEE